MLRTRPSSVTSRGRLIKTLRGMLRSSKFADIKYFRSAAILLNRTNLWQQYADLSEFGYGVAFLSESKYGFACEGNVLRISLLRAATAPDAEQDQGCGFVRRRFLHAADVCVYSREACVLLGSDASSGSLVRVRCTCGRIYFQFAFTWSVSELLYCSG